MSKLADVARPYPVCDSHIHFYDDNYPVWKGATLAHPTKTLADYEPVRAVSQASRFVVVQPSAYGFDNSVLMNSLREANGAARGVAVISRETTEAQLQELAQAGVVGIRANVTLGPLTLDDLPELAARAQSLGWHLQINLSNAQLVENVDAMCALPVPIVIDHFGYVSRDRSRAAQTYWALLFLLSRNDTWLKLSAPYVASSAGAPEYMDLEPYARDLVRRFPTQLVWGSDWPHVTELTPLDEQSLFDTALTWMGCDENQRLILSNNPGRLYGFDTQ